MKLKLLTLSLISIISLTACGGGDEAETDTSNNGDLNVYDHSNFTVGFPTDWEVKEPADFPSNVPDSTIVSFQNKIKDEIFTANVNVSITNLSEAISSKDLAISTLAKAKNSLLAYSEISREEVNLTLNEEVVLDTYIIEFEGKKTSIEEIIRFKQIYYSHNNIGVVATGAYLPSSEETIVNQVDEMLNSLALK
jgi:hypothetical protein